MPTIRDVAKRLQISITTVSRALDGYSDVAEETRELVIKTAQEMGYVPNRAARQLRRQRSDTIGYVLPAHAPQFADPYFSEFIAGLGDESSSNNFDLIVSTAAPDSIFEQKAYERWVQGRKVDGFVLNRMRIHDWRVQFLGKAELPFVCLERSLDDIDYAAIEVDGKAGFKKIMGYLIGKGHQRIAYIGGPPELKIQMDRFAGYRAGLLKAGITIDKDLVIQSDTTRDGGYRAAQALLKLNPRPSAIACINDLTAIGVIHAATELGLKVGRDLAVAGFDGIAEAEHTSPPLTTLNQPVYEIARNLVKMLITIIQGKSVENKRVHIQPELLIRESTGD
jgi:LacI family transcriptional regulator, galactose operon repressor